MKIVAIIFTETKYKYKYQKIYLKKAYFDT
jgi:hypothetical protein